MLSIFGSVIGKVASLFASASSTACVIWFFDEPEAPASIIEK